MSCEKSNFSGNDLDLTALDFVKTLKSRNIDALIETIISTLKKKHFSVDINLSDNPDSYIDSIKKLTSNIRKLLPEDISKEDKATLIRRLKEKLIPPKKTEVELRIEAIIPSQGMLSLQDLNNLNYADAIHDIFGTTLKFRQYGELLFRERLTTLTIIDVKNEVIVDNVHTLNDRLKEFKAEEYVKLKNFIETLTIEGNSFASNLFAKSYYYELNVKSNVSNAYDIMYNYIQYLKSKELLDDRIAEGWNEKINDIDGKNALFFDAVNAFINLLFFDERLKLSFRKYLQIDKDQNEPITRDKNTNEFTYKYTLQTGNSLMVKGWETSDYQDAIDLMSGFTQLLIESIPLISYDEKGLIRQTKLNTVNFVNAIIALRSAITNMAGGFKLQQLLNQTIDHPEKWIDILLTIFKDSYSKTHINNLLDAKSVNGQSYLNKFDLNILYSIFNQVFNTSNPKSYRSIELKYTASVGIKDRYPIVGTLLGFINATAEMNYLELVYDRNAEIPGYKIKIKRKFNSNSTVWDIINAVNRNTYSRIDKQELVALYNLRTNSLENEATLNFLTDNATSNPITIKFSTHLLDKIASVTFSEELEGIYNKKGELKIDLSTQDKMRVLLSNPQGNLKIFIAMLQFIDTMLGTTFSKDVDGLTELREYANQNGKFSSLLASAVRALKICEIYDKIELNSDYQKSEIIRYLTENTNTYGRDFWSTRENLKSFILKTKRGNQFVVLTPGESWLDRLVTARMIINGSTSKAVTKNAAGDSVPNYSPIYLGATLSSYLQEAEEEKGASRNLLFVNLNRRRAIKSVIIDTDVKVKGGNSKAIKDMSESELIYHSIVDKFHLGLTNPTGTVFIQSTTYSDKTKYVGYEISLRDLGIDVYSEHVADNCTTLLFDTVGKFYTDIWNNVLDDYEKIFGTRNIDRIEHLLNNIKELYKQKYGRETSSAELAFVEIANDQGVTIYKDLHYRPNGKGLSINELLYNYGENLYKSIDNLKQRLNIERKQFVNDLLTTLTNFYITRTADGKINYQNTIGNFISKVNVENDPDKNYEKNWIVGNRLILAKVIDRKTGKTRNVEVNLIDVNADEDIILNPFLEAYFSADVLISNNLRFSLTGSEINHKVKGKFSVFDTLGSDISKEFEFTKDTSIVWAMQYLKAVLNDPSIAEERKTLAIEAYNKIKDQLIYSIEAAGQGALLKRNVIISATMRPYLQDLIEGTPSQMRVAVIDDILAVVQNFDGSGCYNKKTKKYESNTVDAHDGFAYINPVMSILENNSLQDNEVGDMKKNILHGYDHRNGVATLLKYAAGAMTNEWMRSSEMSPVSLRNIFKKMSNERWSKRNLDGSIEWVFTDNGTLTGEVDLLRCDYKKNDILNFATDILRGKRLFYQDNGVRKEIVSFGRSGLDYYTKEKQVDFEGNPEGEEIRVYHYFDNEGNYITRSEPIVNKFEIVTREDGTVETIEKYHTIDSIYELWTVMGGLESIELVGKKFQDSEASLYATAAFVNFVANKKEGVLDNADINQSNYDQPLKRAFIGYLVNNTAIKNGAGNLNPVSSFYDDKPFKSITLKVKSHGVQLDADHHADEATMTEFSQVITSLDAGGRMHNYVRLIYSVLGKVAIELSGVELDAVKAFKETGNKSKIYDLIGRTIMKNVKEGQKGLLKAIMTEIKKEFNINSDHELDTFKIPFDDPNIYSQILSTFVSIINKKSIKRQYPGSGMVMMPGYDIETVFDYKGKTYLYQDLIQIAKNTISKEEKSNIAASDRADFNRKLVLKLLQIEQARHVVSDKFDWVNPADRVNIFINDTFLSDINIETIDDYYRFKGSNLREFLLEKLTGFKLQNVVDVEQGKQYTITKGDIITSFIIVPDGSILSTDTITDFVPIANVLIGDIKFLKNVTKSRNLAPVKIYWTMPDGSIMNIFDHWAIRSLYTLGIRNKEAIQRAFDDLNEGIFEPGYIDPETGKAVYTGDIILLDKDKIVSTEAECIVPNIFLSKFGLTSNQSLSSILENPKQFLKKPTILVSDNYDIAFTKSNGRHTYITFKPVQSDTETFNSLIIPWTDTIVEDYENPETGIIQRVFAISKDNIKLFEVARRKVITSVRYDSKLGKFVDSEGNILNDLSRYVRYKDQVLETITFILKRKVQETGRDKYTLYNINKEALDEVYISDNKHTLEDYVGLLMSDIYDSNDFNGVQLNTTMTTKSADILRKSLNSFAKRLRHEQALYELIMGKGDLPGLRSLLLAAEHFTGETYKIGTGANTSILNRYFKSLSNEIRSSFEKSLYFTSSRIPAQSHQSFMLMKAVGFIRSNVTHTFVSHFLTWLQGSDY